MQSDPNHSIQILFTNIPSWTFKLTWIFTPDPSSHLWFKSNLISITFQRDYFNPATAALGSVDSFDFPTQTHPRRSDHLGGIRYMDPPNRQPQQKSYFYYSENSPYYKDRLNENQPFKTGKKSARLWQTFAWGVAWFWESWLFQIQVACVYIKLGCGGTLNGPTIPHHLPQILNYRKSR